jgi:hypothetical protein
MSKKYVVFDMDETIGHFVQFSIFWDAMQCYFGKEVINTAVFNDVMDIYPELIRPSMFTLLKYLDKKRTAGDITGILIYTNNGGGKEWVKLIRGYIEYKLNKSDFFDQTIHAYIVGRKIIEPRRTTNEKTYTDLLRCTEISKFDNVCFIDDQVHSRMSNYKLTYLHIKPYHMVIPYHTMINRLIRAKFLPNDIIKEYGDEFYNFTMYALADQYSHFCVDVGIPVSKTETGVSVKENEEYKYISQQLGQYLRRFSKKTDEHYTPITTRTRPLGTPSPSSKCSKLINYTRVNKYVGRRKRKKTRKQKT